MGLCLSLATGAEHKHSCDTASRLCSSIPSAVLQFVTVTLC